MIIDSEKFKDIPGLTGAVLTESTDGPSQLTLTYGAATPPRHQFMEEMTILHRGRVLFHGKQTGSSYSNNGGAATWTSVSCDARWLLGKQTLGQQINLTAEDMAQAARNAMESWQALAEGSSVSAAGWTCNPDGTSVQGDTGIGLDVSGLTDPPLPAGRRKNSPISILEAIQRLQRNNPGTYTTFDPVTGQVKILKRQDLPESHLHTLQHHVISISGISPNDEDRIPGVVLVIDWNVQINISEGAIISNTGGDAMYGRVVRIFPPDLSPDALGVRVFTQKVTFSVGQYTNESDPFRQEVEAHADSCLAHLIAWMQEVNTPAVTGSITTLMSDWQNSPLATRLSMSGPGAADTMATPVTSVEWDFMDLTTTLTLGKNSIGEPYLSQLYPTQQQFHPRETSSANPGDPGEFPSRSDESSEDSTEAGSGTWPGTWPGPGTGTGSGGGGTGTGGGGSGGSTSQDPTQFCTYFPPPPYAPEGYVDPRNHPGLIRAIQHSPAADVDRPFIDNGIIFINLTPFIG